jgi:hypothetical protein
MMDRQFMTPSHKSAGSKIQEDLIFYTIGLFCIAMVIKFFEFIFKPLEHTKSYDQNEKAITQKIEAKQQARENFLKRIERKVEDPMYQYQERYLINHANHKGDPDNKIYKAWYEQWKKGNVLDSNLKWVPEIYNGSNFNPNFIRYMKVQLGLHKKAPLLNRVQLSNTLFRFYPEFSCSLKGFERDLERYAHMVSEDLLCNELKKEINEFGLNDELAEYLVRKDFSVKDLHIKATVLKTMTEDGCRAEACIATFEKFPKYSDADLVAAAGAIENAMRQTRLSGAICAEALNGDIDGDDLHNIAINMAESINMYGIDICRKRPDGSTMYEMLLSEHVARARARQRASKRALKYT